MGWQLDTEAADGQWHEGYVIGVERVPYLDATGSEWLPGEWSEVGADFDHESTDPAMRARRDVRHVQVACDCGWRSQRLLAPLGTYWAPCCTELPAPLGALDYEDAAWRLWRTHMDGLSTASLWALAREAAGR